MGRGRKGLIEQSSKKPKWDKKGKETFGFYDKVNTRYEDKILFNEHFIEEIKKMDPQDLMNVLQPPEETQKLRKEINKKLSQRKALGWDKVNEAITKAPFCEHNQQIVKILFCYECEFCKWNGLCYKCKKNGEDHFLRQKYYKKDYEDCYNAPYIYYSPKKIYYKNGLYYEDITIIINSHNFNHNKFVLTEDDPDSLKNRSYGIYVIQ